MLKETQKKYNNILKRLNNIVYVLALLVLVGCGTKKKTVSGEKSAVSEPAAPAWHTCLTQARATVTTDDNRVSANVTMQTVRDSMIVISVMPILGMEMIRLEATPMELTAIDKMQGRYAKARFADLNRKFTPSLNWDILQQLCSAELPTGEKKARLQYLFGKKTIELVLDYNPRKLDVPVRVTNQPLTKYQQVDITKWLLNETY